MSLQFYSPVLMQGTGKTELLTIYADLVNSSVPNLVRLFREHLVSLLIVNDLPRYPGVSVFVEKENGRWELKATDTTHILDCLEAIVCLALICMILKIVTFLCTACRVPNEADGRTD